MAIHVHEEIVHEDEEDSSIYKKKTIHLYREIINEIIVTFIATASKAPSVG